MRLRRASSIVSDVRGGLAKPKMKNPTRHNDRVIYYAINRQLDKIRMYIRKHRKVKTLESLYELMYNFANS